MLREESLQEISDGKKYRSTDMVRADAHGCAGCHACCTGMGDSVVLDPQDVFRLSRGLGRPASDLIGKELELGIYDGNILPHLAMRGEEEACVFLNTEGRCSIHPIRLGFCRMFPLGRYYEDRRFSYILQVHECPSTKKSKVRVSKWLDLPDIRSYEKFVLSWHNFLQDAREVLEKASDPELARNLNLYIVKKFYLLPYDMEADFYVQFYDRLKEGQELLALS